MTEPLPELVEGLGNLLLRLLRYTRTEHFGRRERRFRRLATFFFQVFRHRAEVGVKYRHQVGAENRTQHPRRRDIRPLHRRLCRHVPIMTDPNGV